MTARQTQTRQRVLDALRTWDRPWRPSFRDLEDKTGIPLGTLHRTCAGLRADCLIEYGDNVARSLKVVHHPGID